MFKTPVVVHSDKGRLACSRAERDGAYLTSGCSDSTDRKSPSHSLELCDQILLRICYKQVVLDHLAINTNKSYANMFLALDVANDVL